MIRVLVVEDSPVIQEFLRHIIDSDPALEIVGVASDGQQALEMVRSKKPDIITMDIHMPKMDGITAARAIMETQPTPIVVVSGSTNAQEVGASFEAIEAGVLAVVERPSGVGHAQHEESANRLIETLKVMAEVKVIRRWSRRPVDPFADPNRISLIDSPVRVTAATSCVRLVAIGASTGGPFAIQRILLRLPKDFQAPILIVQHMSPGFIQGFVQWLVDSTQFPVRIGEHGEIPLAGQAYIAPDECHMLVSPKQTIALSKGDPDNGLRPSVAQLFRSVAEVYGRHAVGVLLSGMGKDGARELRMMKERGAVTLVQDKKSSIVNGMPGEAVQLGASTYVLSPDEISVALTSLVGPAEGVSSEQEERHA